MTPRFQLLTPSDLTSLSGAVTIVFLVSQTVRYFFGFDPRRVGYVTSLLLSLFGTWISADHTLAAWVTAVANSFIIFASAAGLSGMANATKKRLTGKNGKGHVMLEEIHITKNFWEAWY